MSRFPFGHIDKKTYKMLTPFLISRSILSMNTIPKKGSGRPPKYFKPLLALQVGQSAGPFKSGAIRRCAFYWAVKLNRQFTTRQGPDGVTVWRVA